MIFKKVSNDFMFRNGGVSQLSKFNNEYLLSTLLYAKMCENQFNNISHFSINSILMFLGEKPHRSTNIPEVRKAIKILIEEGYFKEINFEVDKIKLDSCILVRVDMQIKQKDNKDTNFFQFDYENIKRILQEDTKLKRRIILNVYAYINARTYKRDIPTVVAGGKARVFYGTFEDVAKDCLVSENTLRKYLVFLKDLKLIDYDNIGCVKRGGKIINATTVFTIYERR